MVIWERVTLSLSRHTSCSSPSEEQSKRSAKIVRAGPASWSLFCPSCLPECHSSHSQLMSTDSLLCNLDSRTGRSAAGKQEGTPIQPLASTLSSCSCRGYHPTPAMTKYVKILYDFTARNANELSVLKDEVLEVRTRARQGKWGVLWDQGL